MSQNSNRPIFPILPALQHAHAERSGQPGAAAQVEYTRRMSPQLMGMEDRRTARFQQRLRCSLLWRVTAPLRALRRLVRHGARTKP